MKTQNPWMGRARKSAGGMTATKMFSSNVLRSKPIEVANPNTPAQQTQRNFFKSLTECANELSEDVLRSLFPKTPAKRSRRSELAKQLAGYNSTVGQTKTLDFTAAPQLGNGKIGAIDVTTIDMGDSENTTAFSWDSSEIKDLTAEQLHEANVILEVFDDDKKKMRVINTSAKLDDDTVSINNNELPAGLETDYSTLSAVVTFSENNDNVNLRGFGSFTVRRRAQKTGRTPQH